MHTVITIGRQFGSGGTQIGRNLAKELDVPFYDKHLLKQAAVDAGLGNTLLDAYGEKHASSLLYSLATGAYSFGYYDANQPQAISQKAYLTAFEIIKQVARNGPCVIVGRCADYVLQGQAQCFNVFVYAPLAARAAAAAQQLGTGLAEAEKNVQEVDRLRRNYYNYYTNKSWGEINSYHLCLDSCYLGADGAVELLVQQARLRR